MAAAKGERKAAPERKKPKKEKEKRGEARGDKERPRRGKDREKARPLAPAPADPAPAPAPGPAALDPDAVQLFRRYDRSRLGRLSRCDFLQLLRDYASPAGWAARPPLSLALADAGGVPLGYARADRNSEFEAGQLFERYDADRSGTLSIDRFGQFFADFRPQLVAFVQDAAFFGAPVAPLTPPPHELDPAGPDRKQGTNDTSQETNARPPSPAPNLQQQLKAADAGKDEQENNSDSGTPSSLKRQYQSALWELHKLCRGDLDSQRQRIIDQMSVIRSEMARRQRARSDRDNLPEKRTVRFLRLPRDGRRQRRDFSSDEDDDAMHRGFDEVSALYETLEADLDHIDEITRFLRRYHRIGNEATAREMKKFLAHAPVAKEEVQFLAMKDYGDHDWQGRRRASSPHSRTASPSSASSPSPPSSPRGNKDVTASPGNQQQLGSPPSPLPHQQQHRERELEELLRIKDQMIYQLLQERAAMRRDKTAMESYLKTLSRVSSQEMQKWAQLTDEMQDEIERLRAQLPIPRRSASRAV